MAPSTDLSQGTLDMLILKKPSMPGPERSGAARFRSCPAQEERIAKH